eukprot:GDKJ01024518.1.p1 GENE.GDKJ01024518.1~~GDKJ01024518.1.p1  ORF type:complete len:137 (-),score=37.37 GDKJ01024518.1:75-485(-)
MYLEEVRRELQAWISDECVLSPARPLKLSPREDGNEILGMFRVDPDVIFHTVVGLRKIAQHPPWLFVKKSGVDVEVKNENLHAEKIQKKTQSEQGKKCSIGIAGLSTLKQNLRSKIQARRMKMKTQDAFEILSSDA